jgi:transcription initiation factor IIE alpha subunit
MRQKVLVGATVICSPPARVTNCHRSLEDEVRAVESWCRNMENFIRDHRSQDDISLTVQREYQFQCSFCGAVLEDDGELPGCCSRAQEEWELRNE